MFAEHDLKEADKLLDEMGLDEKDNDGIRIGFDGKPIHVVVEYNQYITRPKILELVEEYWTAVGIKTSMAFDELSLLRTATSITARRSWRIMKVA